MTDDAFRPVPALLNLRARRAVVLGAGASADRAIDQLLSAGAVVVHLTGDPSVPGAAGGFVHDHSVMERGYVRGDLAGAAVALCYVPDPEVQTGFAAEAMAERCLVYVAGVPSLSTFDLQRSNVGQGE